MSFETAVVAVPLPAILAHPVRPGYAPAKQNYADIDICEY
jgi:hypothetical protein